ncbi:hypothetical protein BDY21DRAFT_75451 [Lineolata rhizophorae]|uniref:Uncharacterized protein n=1 Tax=Lineolata rhizophorae TaxID=578093 RepID=A0A6A6NVW2_9PEZI|nr:hypothetical protein BDY21DRAFT_75451 [Lineolata rhizophorae]
MEYRVQKRVHIFDPDIPARTSAAGFVGFHALWGLWLRASKKPKTPRTGKQGPEIFSKFGLAKRQNCRRTAEYYVQGTYRPGLMNGAFAQYEWLFHQRIFPLLFCLKVTKPACDGRMYLRGSSHTTRCMRRSGMCADTFIVDGSMLVIDLTAETSNRGRELYNGVC